MSRISTPRFNSVSPVIFRALPLALFLVATARRQAFATAIGDVGSVFEKGNTVTVITNVPHGLLAGEKIFIQNVSVAQYNGIFVVSKVLSADSFTYLNSDKNLPPAGDGTVDLFLNTGDVDPTFNPNVSIKKGQVDVAAVQPDGNIIFAGFFT